MILQARTFRREALELVLLLSTAAIGLTFFETFGGGYPELAPFGAMFAGSAVVAALLVRLWPELVTPWIPMLILMVFPLALVLFIIINFRLAEQGNEGLRGLLGLGLFSLPLFAGVLAALQVPAQVGRRSAGAYVLTVAAAGALAFLPPAAGNVWRPLPEARFETIDENRGRYGNVGIGAAPSDVVRAHGEPVYLGENDKHVPTGLDENDVAEGPNGLPAGPNSLAYPDSLFYLRRGSVVGFEVISPGAETLRGIEIGDSLDEARRVYPELECGEATAGGDPPDLFPYCAGRMAPGVHVWFGGDPVSSIVVFNQGFG